MTKIGLDLGYANITLSDESANIYREPSVALIHKSATSEQGRIISVGNDAMMGSTAADALPVRPFKNGILFDSQLTAEIISHAFKSIRTADKIRCIVGVPSDFLPKQEKELLAMLKSAGVDTAAAVARPVAAIVGAGYSPAMSVISVNIGALSTEVAVICKGEVIYLERHPIGGEDFDKEVKQFILEQGDVNISLGVARTIKERLGAVWKGKPNESIDIEGTLSLTGNQLRMNLTTEDIVGVFEKPMQELIKAIVGGIKRIPNDCVQAVFENGIVLTGGGAELFGIEQLLSKVLGVMVTKPQDPMDCVAKGLARINGFLPPRVKYDGRNITSKLAKYYEESKK